jgi:hypothetical protein
MTIDSGSHLPPPGGEPTTVAWNLPDKVANWRVVGNPVMAIPHLVVASVLRTVAEVVAVISWFAIVFTGKLPVGLANFQCMYLRYEGRAYTFAGFLYEQYPPFAFAAQPADPADFAPIRIDLAPQLEDRNRLTVGFRIILAIPLIIVYAIYAIGAIVVWIIAFFAVLFTGTWPEGMRSFIKKVYQFGLRVETYLYLLTDTYPSFSLS